MFSPNSSDSELLKSLLEPLLDDFLYWFGRSRIFLESEEVSFLDADQQADLLARVVTAQQEVSTAQMLFKMTDSQVGVETTVLANWHQLVTECWQVAVKFRLSQSAEKGI